MGVATMPIWVFRVLRPCLLRVLRPCLLGCCDHAYSGVATMPTRVLQPCLLIPSSSSFTPASMSQR